MYPVLLAASISKWAADYREYIQNLDWTQVATVVVAGIGIVLAVLIVFIFIFKAFGLAMEKGNGAGQKNK